MRSAEQVMKRIHAQWLAHLLPECIKGVEFTPTMCEVESQGTSSLIQVHYTFMDHAPTFNAEYYLTTAVSIETKI